ncbi:hypothetical protein QZH41_006962 [Actinostola sp. cb2023]|nr:hypothetical protein QZH41_006962 [Actinostola sp. cb2023]
MERKTSQSEVQFGSLVDLRPEELEQACAATWKMSTPRPRSDSLRTAIEDLLKKISKQNRLLEDRLEELDKRLRTLEGESKHVGKYVPLEGGQSEVELKALETTGSLAQPRAIDSSKIQPATARPKVRPTTYNGSSSWEDYAAQFQLVAEINNWDYVTKASYLAISLSGPALSVLGDLSYDQRRDFKDITSALATRFGTETSDRNVQGVDQDEDAPEKRVTTRAGSGSSRLATNLRPMLRTQNLTDEELMKSVNEMASHQIERKNKLATERQKTARVNVCVSEGGQKNVEHPKKTDASSDDVSRKLLAEIKQMRSELCNLKVQVDATNVSNAQGYSEQTRPFRGRGRGRGRPYNQQRRAWGCSYCKERGTAESCRHCFACGGDNHFAYNCPHTATPDQGNDGRLPPRDRK